LSGEILFVTAEKVKDFIAEARSAAGDASTSPPAKRTAWSAARDCATEHGKLFCNILRLALLGWTEWFFTASYQKNGKFITAFIACIFV
jgi:hypothetical protein